MKKEVICLTCGHKYKVEVTPGKETITVCPLCGMQFTVK